MSQRIAILGGGESGIGAARLASAKGLDVFISDAGTLSQKRKDILTSKGIAFEENGHTESKILNADYVVKSPGISDSSSLMVKLRKLGILVISEIEFGYQYLPKKAKVIAITGTNGKTTTTLLTHHLLTKSGLHTAVGGNIGTSFSGLIAQEEHDYYVLEVSSFQLDGIQNFRPDIAVILNITPDHLERYEYDFGKYVNAKFRIIENLTEKQCFIYNRDSDSIVEELRRRKVDAYTFEMTTSQNERVEAYLKDNHLIFNCLFEEKSNIHRIHLSDTSLIGKHNIINTMAAVMSSLCMNLSIQNIIQGLKTFKNAPHRLELIRIIHDVSFINDSKATNVDATFFALDGVKSKIIWIVGGVDKGNNYSKLINLVNQKVKTIICLGIDNSKVKKAFMGVNAPIYETRDMKTCVAQSLQFASKGDTVLLSPACASFDLFENYEDRGSQFKIAVQSLKEEKQEI